mmetsp:Transcript_11951/g.36794  ORF Transcript_11951/g.36794 Transcript_11951/m.36794 type:complete len:289 (+) Transcript_11951:600-1466(+)
MCTQASVFMPGRLTSARKGESIQDEMMPLARCELAQPPALTTAKRQHCLLQVCAVLRVWGGLGPWEAWAELPCPLILCLGTRGLHFKHLLIAQVVRDHEAGRIHCAVRGVAHRARHGHERDRLVRRGKCVAKRDVRVAAVPVHPLPMRGPTTRHDVGDVRRAREPAAKVRAHDGEGTDHKGERTIHPRRVLAARAALHMCNGSADGAGCPAAMLPLVNYKRVVLHVASVDIWQSERRPEEGGEARHVDKRVVVCLGVERCSRKGDWCMAEPRKELVNARVDAATLVEI